MGGVRIDSVAFVVGVESPPLAHPPLTSEITPQHG